ncbi:MAG: hypothetical protein QOI97_5103 [Pseudomonas sp.]|nr:hypothetical protein [Pseudomonas sp.]
MWLLLLVTRATSCDACESQRVYPSGWVGHVLVRVNPTRQLHRVRRQVTTNIRIVVAMTVVVQPAFRVEVLALEAQRVVDFADVEAGNLAVGAVVRRPDDFAVWVCKLLRCSEVVELVVEGLGVFRAKAFQQCQRAEAVRFVEVTAMAIRMVFGNQLVACQKTLWLCRQWFC